MEHDEGRLPASAEHSGQHTPEHAQTAQGRGKTPRGIKNEEPVPAHERKPRRKPHAKAGKKSKTKKAVMAKKKMPPKKGKGKGKPPKPY